jgi:acetyl-CoA carboxylase, biotin carboxylase subunit
MTKPKVLVANRSAVAARVIRTLNQMGVDCVAVYSDADRDAPYLEMATETYGLGEPAAIKSYLNQDALLEAMKKTGATALHPGYGFLSENAGFAQRLIDAGHTFIGPNPDWIRKMGHKTKAREFAAAAGWPLGSGSDLLPPDSETILAMARQIGYPVIVKPAEGGGGIGMLVAHDENQLLEAVDRAGSMAQRGFGSKALYLESLCIEPRHIEFQVVGDKYGDIRVLYERDCSIQRRHQKIIEEATAPGIARSVIDQQCAQIEDGLRNLGYDSLGTIEMLRGNAGDFRFLEMNTRLQVEHGVTEEILGVDLVRAQVLIAFGEKLSSALPPPGPPSGHAIQLRVYAEDSKRFYPSPGKLQSFKLPALQGIRVETGYMEGMDVTPFYDPLLAKIIAHAPTRDLAIAQLMRALDATTISGVSTNIDALRLILQSSGFASGSVHTGLAMEVVQAANKKSIPQKSSIVH